MSSLYIIDGHAQFFRAYYAIRTPMSSPATGEPTNMVYGFTSMLLKLLRDENPDHLAVVIDVASDEESFRTEIDPEYKANREPPPDDFGSQVDRCLEILEALEIPILGEPVVEADDVIASLVKRVRKEQPEMDIRIISRDKDSSSLTTSITTARWSGFSSRSNFSNIDVNPYTMFVGSPVAGLLIGVRIA